MYKSYILKYLLLIVLIQSCIFDFNNRKYRIVVTTYTTLINDIEDEGALLSKVTDRDVFLDHVTR